MELSQLLSEYITVSGEVDCTITGLSSNSKMVKEGHLFFAFPGAHVDGRRYIKAAIKNGAIAILSESNLGIGETLHYEGSGGRKVPVFTLKNLINEASSIAGKFFNNPSFQMDVIGITGTNGKTSCAYYLAAAFSNLGIKAGIMGTVGCGIYGKKLVSTGMTTPDFISVQKLLAKLRDGGAKVVAMEVSSHALAQRRVSGVKFTHGLFTNLSHDHLDYHETMEQYWSAKKMLFESFNLHAAILNANDFYGQKLLNKLWGTQYVYGFCDEDVEDSLKNISLVKAENVSFSRHGIKALIRSPWGSGVLHSRQLGRFNLSNLLAVITVMGAMGIHIDDILETMEVLPVVPGRMQTFHSKKKPLVVVDYAHTPDALANVLMVLRENCEGKLWCVFGCGGTRDGTKRPIMGEISERLADKVILTDDNPRMETASVITDEILQGMQKPEKVIVEHERAKAIAYAIKNAALTDTVVIAGKGHETYQHQGRYRRHFCDVEEVEKYF